MSKSFRQKVEAILADACDYVGHSRKGCVICKENTDAILLLVKGIVPEKRGGVADREWNKCRQQILTKLEEGSQ